MFLEFLDRTVDLNCNLLRRWAQVLYVWGKDWKAGFII